VSAWTQSHELLLQWTSQTSERFTGREDIKRYMPGIERSAYMLFNQATGGTLPEFTNNAPSDISLPCMLEQYKTVVLPVNLQPGPVALYGCGSQLDHF